MTRDNDLGTFCLVLHSHLPWLAHHGAWPVGEEWLHQSWAASYDPLLGVLRRLADDGLTDQVTLGVTPVLAAQLDDPYLLDAHQTWLHNAHMRATGMTADPDPVVRARGRREALSTHRSIASFEDNWMGGGSPALRSLMDSGVIELLGGPAAHPFQPLLDDRVLDFSLRAGLDDTTIRLGSRPKGLWAPECGYRTGMAQTYRDAGISHFLVDGPTLRRVGVDTHQAHPIGDTGVLAFGRDLDVSYRVWSPRSGYPGGRWYRDFHAHDHEWGFRDRRVTSKSTPGHEKARYDVDRAAAAVERDVADFVATVTQRLTRIKERDGRPGLSVAAFDTELFGHWWHEGPQWLEAVLRRLPEAGVTVSTLRGAAAAGHVGAPIEPQSSSWGAGKDWHIWDGDAVHPIVADNSAAQGRVLDYFKGVEPAAGRNRVADQLAQDLLLALASDWAFMISHDSAADYAWGRHHDHHRALHALADAVEQHGWDGPAALALAGEQRLTDGPFGGIDARSLR